MITLLQLSTISLISLVLMSGCTQPKTSSKKKEKTASTAPAPTTANKMTAFSGKNPDGTACRTPEHALTGKGTQRITQECELLADHRINRNCAVDDRKRAFDQKCSQSRVQWTTELADLEAAGNETAGNNADKAVTRSGPRPGTGTPVRPAATRENSEGDDSLQNADRAPLTSPAPAVVIHPGVAGTPTAPAVAAPRAGVVTEPRTSPNQAAGEAHRTEEFAVPFQRHLNIRTAQLAIQVSEFAGARELTGDQAKNELESSIGLISVDEENSPQVQQDLSEDYKTITRNMITRIEECEPDLEGASCDLDNAQGLIHRFIERADREQKATIYHLVQRHSRTNRPGETADHKQIVFLYEIKGDADGNSAKLKKIDSINLSLLILKSPDKKISNMQELKTLIEEQTTANRTIQLTAQMTMKQISYTLLLNRMVTANKISLLFYKFERARDPKLLENFAQFKSSTDDTAVYASKEEMRADLKDVVKIAMATHTRSMLLKNTEDNTSPQTRYNSLFVRNLTTRLAEFANTNSEAKESIISFILTGLENSSDKIKQYSAIGLRLMDPHGENEVLKAHEKYNEVLELLRSNQIAGNDAELKQHLESKRAAMKLNASATVTTTPAAATNPPARGAPTAAPEGRPTPSAAATAPTRAAEPVDSDSDELADE
jgi:hypothetical protein